MADETITESAKSVRERVQRAVDQFTLSAQTYQGQRARETEYLEFQVPEKQWPKEILDYRKSQFGNQGVPTPPDPTLSISMIDEPIQLVENQFRAANIEPHIHPMSEGADADTATVLEELNRHIDADPESRADNARSWSFSRSLRAGTGWRYIDKVFDPQGGHPFDQKLLVKRLLYQDSIFPDPTAQMLDWSDGMFLHDIVDLPWEAYKRKYPRSKMANYGSADFTALGPELADWIAHATDEGKRSVRVSNYWRVDITMRKYVLLNDGSVEFEDEIPAGKRRATDEDLEALAYGGLTEREVEIRCVYKSVINGVEELEPETEWDGQYIPYVPSIGIELQPFDGERRWVGMTAGAMDAQRLVNYSASQAVKLAAMETQAVWQAEEGVLPEPFLTQYRESNVRKNPVLFHAATNAAGMRANAPTRVQVDTSRLGPSMELLAMGKQFVETATFTYGPGRGEQTPAHRSGKAITALQGQTVQGNSHFLDNEANISLPLEMKIKLDLIPHVYDRPGRVVQVITGEGNPRGVILNQPFSRHPQTGQPRPVELQPNAPLPDGVTHFDLNKGRYGVSVTIGKKNDSRLQEGSDAVGRLMEADPQLLPILGPSWAKFQDFPGARAVSEALKKWQAHVAPWMSDQDQQNLQADNQHLKAQLQKVTEAAQKMKQDLDTDAVKYQMQHQTEVAIKDLESKTTIQIQQMKDATQIEVARINAAKEGMIAEREAAEERLATGLKIEADAAKQALDHGHAATQAELDRQHEHATMGLEHGATAAGALQDHAQNLAVAEQGNQHALEQVDAQRQAAEAAQPAASGSDANNA